jgi:hypothetical protein
LHTVLAIFSLRLDSLPRHHLDKSLRYLLTCQNRSLFLSLNHQLLAKVLRPEQHKICSIIFYANHIDKWEAGGGGHTQGSYKTWKSLNLKTKIQGLEFVKKYLNVLNFSCFSFWIFSELFDIQNGHFVELILHVHIWQSHLKLIITLKLRFEQFNVRFYWFLTPFLQYLVPQFADTWPWKVLEFDFSWHLRTPIHITCSPSEIREGRGIHITCSPNLVWKEPGYEVAVHLVKLGGAGYTHYLFT